MTMRPVAILAALTAAFSLAACGGGSGSSSAPVIPQTGPSAAPVAPAITQAFQVTLPATTPATSTSTVRQPKDLSPNTGSIAIALQSVNGQSTTIAPTIAKLAAGAPGCATTNGVTVCTISATAATGVDVFSVTTYQSSNGSGSALAATTIGANVPAGGGMPPLPLALGGVPAKVAFSPASLPLVNDGAIHRFPVTLQAIDASGATIVGATAYQSAVALQILSDPTHALSLSTASVTQPGTVVTVTFDGSKQLANATIQAQATSVPTATLAAAPLSVSPSPVLVYDDQAGGVPVTLTQAGFSGGFTASAAAPQDASVAITSGPLQSGSAVATIVPKTTFDVTMLNVGNGLFSYGVPLQIVPHNGKYQAIGSTHQLLQAANMVQGPDGNFWTGDAQAGTIVKFNPASGSYTPIVVDSSKAGPLALAFDANGNVWFADGGRIGEYVPGSGTTTFYSTGLQSTSQVRMIIAGAPGTMWFYDEGANGTGAPSGKPTSFGTINTANGQITEYPTGNGAAPLIGPMSMVVGPDGAIWFADGYRLAIGRVDPTSGKVTEFSMSSPSYPVTAPMKLVVAPDGTLWFLASETQTGAGLVGTIATKDGTIQQYPLPTGGIFTALAVGSDHNLWFGVDPAVGFFYQSQSLLGVVNPTTHAVYTYPAITPDNGAISGIIDRGDRTLWILDSGFGQIGKVPFT
jgi:streptogramin lyase